MHITIRTAQPSDLDALTRIYNQAIDAGLKTGDTERVSVESRLAWMQEHLDGVHPILVAVGESKVVGYLAIGPYRKGRKALSRTVEVSVYIDSDDQKQGIGTRLLTDAIAVCLANGIKTLIAIVIDANAPSQRLLQAFGFAQWGLLPDVLEYQGREYSHIYFGKRLLSCPLDWVPSKNHFWKMRVLRVCGPLNRTIQSDYQLFQS